MAEFPSASTIGFYADVAHKELAELAADPSIIEAMERRKMLHVTLDAIVAGMAQVPAMREREAVDMTAKSVAILASMLKGLL